MSMAEKIDCDHGGTIHSCPVCIREREEEGQDDAIDLWEDMIDTAFVPADGFPARYESDCPDCGSRIEPGEMIFMRDGRAVCEVCA